MFAISVIHVHIFDFFVWEEKITQYDWHRPICFIYYKYILPYYCFVLLNKTSWCTMLLRNLFILQEGLDTVIFTSQVLSSDVLWWRMGRTISSMTRYGAFVYYKKMYFLEDRTYIIRCSVVKKEEHYIVNGYRWRICLL